MPEFLKDKLLSGKSTLRGLPDKYIRIAEKKFLLDCKEWKDFVQVFVEKSDDTDDGWRGEYWGKTMRGACLCYNYTKNGKLYKTLEQTVKDILSTQDERGRISSYSVEKEFNGWDIWSRKYVATGLLHFADICKDENLRNRITDALEKHLSYIAEKIGDKPNQKDILQTSVAWGAVNSCTILEPILDYYIRTGKDKYLRFAEYIVSTGGSSLGNLIDAVKNGVKPADFPVKKAYEVMSFFEGLLLYYKVTGKKEYLDVVEKFIALVADNEISIVGGAGYLCEEFYDTVVKQTTVAEYPTQETCVAVTWIRLLTKTYQAKDKVKYIDYIEKTALNAFYGSVNVNLLKIKKTCKDKGCLLLGPFAFDSYSPVFYGLRSRGVGGLKQLPSGKYSGCCATIGVVALAIVPLLQVFYSGDSVTVNTYFKGTSYIGDEKSLEFSCDYYKGKIKIQSLKDFGSVKLRVPYWTDGATIAYNKQVIGYVGDYCEIADVKKGSEILIEFKTSLKVVTNNDFYALIYGPLVLCLDSQKNKNQDIVNLPFQNLGNLSVKPLKPEKYEMLRVMVSDGKACLMFTDYASCGKKWNNTDDYINVWYKKQRS